MGLLADHASLHSCMGQPRASPGLSLPSGNQHAPSRLQLHNLLIQVQLVLEISSPLHEAASMGLDEDGGIAHFHSELALCSPCLSATPRRLQSDCCVEAGVLFFGHPLLHYRHAQDGLQTDRRADGFLLGHDALLPQPSPYKGPRPPCCSLLVAGLPVRVSCVSPLAGRCALIQP